MSSTSQDELAAAIDGRAHWPLSGRTAVYAPPDSTARVQVNPMPDAARHRERFQAVIIRGDRTRPAGTATEAIRWAERMQLT